MPLNLPNILTVLRIAMALGVMRFLFLPGFWPKLAALILFLLATLTDWVDGKLARKWGQITEFGALWDPIADKLLILGTLFCLMMLAWIRLWMLCVIAGRELFVTVLRMRQVRQGGGVISASQSGKWKTSFQFVVIVGILLFLVLRECAFWRPEWDDTAFHVTYWSMLFIVGFTLWSGVRVLVKNARK